MSIIYDARLAAEVARLQERWGAGVIRKPEGSANSEQPHISTTWARLDAAIGIGGIPRAALTECVGSSTAGLTTLALNIIAGAQAYHAHPTAAWVDYSKGVRRRLCGTLWGTAGNAACRPHGLQCRGYAPHARDQRWTRCTGM